MTDRAFAFRVTHRDGLARRGELSTAHGSVQTPAFMPVGTRGAVKAITQRDLLDLGAEIILGNTYHLYLRPGDGLIARAGGLHRFIGWDRPILTDSGGYQIFSLAAMRHIRDEGAEFRSHLDGSLHLLTPERASDIQTQLGSDIAMVLDHCLASASDEAASRDAMERSAAWAARARARFLDPGRSPGAGLDVIVSNPGQAQFGIVQGGVHPALRTESVERTVAIGFDGYAIGGLSVGEPVEVMYEVIGHTAPLLPEDCPRYLMGTGMPDDLIESVARGVDLFDCVLPTRNARNGQLLTSRGPLAIKNARYAEDLSPPDPDCGCYTCRHFSRAYLRHLYLSGEMTAATLNTLHNLYFYLDTMRRIREAIVFGSFERLRQEFRQTFSRRPQH
ncbi:MAG: tRNA guanosine(34) transglycosylase Tgt [Acidobacteria bacterium RIFCSPLOWO2_12_FULL_66_21]|nr:MAG: tRNA guanosine(34) transglycosylase Tgt [Acidobacteria bacterium RIFCSPLOWO2_12_FULL_66_21]